MITEAVRARSQVRWAIPALFTATIFLSASLLFFVQPLFTKIVLPHIGGASAVWTTAMLFFQTVLIAGYLYAHLSTTYLPVRAQVLVHMALWAVALLFLPLSVTAGWTYDPDGSPVLQTLFLYATGVGLPFAVLSANAPLIQSWYAKSGGPSADDPYFLYGASNLGSFAALLAFPLAADRLFGAEAIGLGWAAGFVVLGAGLLGSGMTARGRAQGRQVVREETRPDLKTIGFWLFLAFVPSSLMLALTTKLTTDLGSVPLIWVVPLSLYLLSFVVAFRKSMPIGSQFWRIGFLLSIALITALVSGLVDVGITWSRFALVVLAFFVIAVVAHRRLYDARPDHSHLTLFYLCMSIGGALGGLFNSIVAPIVFNDLHETRITIVLAALVLAPMAVSPGPRVLLRKYLIGALMLFPVLSAAAAFDLFEVNPHTVLVVGAFGAALICLVRTPVLVSVACAGLIVLGTVPPKGQILFQDRSFFGVHKVQDWNTLRTYSNGTTVHGAQWLSDLDAPRPRGTYYYHASAGMAQVLTSDVGRQAQSVGIVGLGIGALACYALPGQRWQYYEIDKTVDALARDPAFFSFVPNCTPQAPTHMGDARIVLAGQPEQRYDVLVIDAYSSDAVPMHLTTREAVQLYMDRMSRDGVLVFHISNRYYDLSGPLARIAASLGLEARLQQYVPPEDHEKGDSHSTVLMMARSAEAFGDMEQDARWIPLSDDGGRVWTDDHADLLSALR